MKRALRRAIRVAGCQAELARRLGITSMAVTQWRKRGRIPAEWVTRIEEATGGAVTREELRPDLYVARGAA